MPAIPSRKELVRAARSCRAKFVGYYPKGFVESNYVELERDYKCSAHQRWTEELSRKRFEKLLSTKRYKEIAARAVAIKSRTNLLFSLRDGVKTDAGARLFSKGLHRLLYGPELLEVRFKDWICTVAAPAAQANPGANLACPHRYGISCPNG